MQGSCGVAQIKRRRAEKSILSRRLTQDRLPPTLSAMSLIEIRAWKGFSIFHQFALFPVRENSTCPDEVMLVLSPGRVVSCQPCDMQFGSSTGRLPWISKDIHVLSMLVLFTLAAGFMAWQSFEFPEFLKRKSVLTYKKTKEFIFICFFLKFSAKVLSEFSGSRLGQLWTYSSSSSGPNTSGRAHGTQPRVESMC